MSIAIRFCIVAGVVVAALALAGGNAANASPARQKASAVVLTDSERTAVGAFEARIKDYMRVHRKLEASLPNDWEHGTTEQVGEKQRAFGALIKAARAGAKQGEFFTPDIQALVKRTLVAVFAQPDGKTTRALIMDENPGMPNLAVNDRYPDELPLSTMPKSVLKPLPELEEDLEYRFVGDRLTLMDAEARIIIDFIDNVLP